MSVAGRLFTWLLRKSPEQKKTRKPTYSVQEYLAFITSGDLNTFERVKPFFLEDLNNDCFSIEEVMLIRQELNAYKKKKGIS